MASNNKGAAIGAILAACAAAASMVIGHEGWKTNSYLDVTGKPTACAGVTEGVKAGQTYSDADCTVLTAAALAAHGAEIAKCLPDQLPTDTRGAFTSFAYNVGAPKFCGSTMAAKARAGDLKGACAELSRWVFVGGKDCREPKSTCSGIVTRRADERALCERGLG